MLHSPFTLASLLTLALSAHCGSRASESGARPQSARAERGAVARSSQDEFTRHVDELKKRLPSEDFSVVVQRPFVVVGDGPARAVRSHAEETVGWAVERLRKDFFKNDPREIIDIWLFKDAASYRKHARELFGDEPDTPYGYYSNRHKALVMNIETGGGTLVHEIVHPLMEANFPGCPPWFNEGMGSLFEACGDVDGHIRGFTNWRLPGLQRAIKSGKLPPFKTLMAMDARAFYRADTGTNYAQARYLCYYLQEKGRLVSFYREFTNNHAQDPTGIKSLQKVLGERDVDAFQRRWEKYVLGLTEEFRLTPAP